MKKLLGIRWVLALMAVVVWMLSAALAEKSGPKQLAPRSDIRFDKDIRPILSHHCFKCHGPDIKKAGIDFQDRHSAFKELKSGNRAIVPGKSVASELIRRVTAPDNERMPPAEKGEPLSPQEVAKLRTWIDEGATWAEHWAYVKPVRSALPEVKNRNWPRNPIDYFVLARLEKEGLFPSAEVDRATLIRRVRLDLTGLPPTPEEVDVFLSDQSRDAYEKVVERLLNSPHYGERQALPWLDQARYADTNGYEKDDRRTIWPYRDWVIGAFNRDLPFDQFTIEQVAGDLLPRATREQQIATGLNRNAMVNTEGGTDDEEFRVAALVDRVNTTMAVWMGTTFGCCQCHSHKYDPFTQTEYYRLMAFFNGTEDRGRTNDPILRLPTPEQVEQEKKLDAEIDQIRALLRTSTRQLAEAQAKWEKAGPGKPPAAALPKEISSVLAIPTPKRTEAQKEQLVSYYRSIAPELAGARQRIEALTKQKASIQPATTLVMKELPQPRATYVMIRGNFRRHGALVTPGVPARLHPLPPGQPLNRLAFARWLVDPNNPLVGRVIMNRMWAQYFGRGLVETSEDFGIQGEPPTHPELLDWLATELIRQKWSQKAMHRNRRG
jgi:hypothetical protein